MLKRGIALLLCLLLTVGMVSVHAAAVTQEEEVEIFEDLRTLYRRIQRASGYGSLRGLCGLMTTYELYLLGVDTKPLVENGKDVYNTYDGLELTSGGHVVNRYPATDYTMEEALRTITHDGTRDTYNLLLGFHWTNTTAGGIYGHANVVRSIQDGTVYFMESFHTSIGGAAGTPIACTMEEIAGFYGDWTQLEGVIEFGSKSYLDFCREYGADLYVRAEQPVQLLTLPVAAGQEGSEVLCEAVAGERLRVTALYENREGQYYYEVEDAGSVSYIPTETVSVLRLNYEDVLLLDAEVPQRLEKGRDFTVSGEVRSQHNLMTGMRISVKDASGEEVMSYTLDNDSRMYTLGRKKLNQKLRFNTLPEGGYTYEIYAGVNNHYVENGIVCSESTSIQLCSADFTVGNVANDVRARTVVTTQQPQDGWVFRYGTWYYYENGKPRTGWLCDGGIDYYLRSDGTVATGWTTVNGKERFFSDTGAMRTGWLQTEDGTYYLLSNGEKAVRWREIDGKQYYFGQDGLLQKNTWLTEADKEYYLGSDGSMVTGWYELGDAKFFFSQDGSLLAQACEVGGETIIRMYDPEKGSIVSPGAVYAARLIEE